MDEQQKPILDYSPPPKALTEGTWRDWGTATLGLPSVYVGMAAAFVCIADGGIHGGGPFVRLLAGLGAATALAGVCQDRCKPMACVGLVFNTIVLLLTTFL